MILRFSRVLFAFLCHELVFTLASEAKERVSKKSAATASVTSMSVGADGRVRHAEM